MIVLIKAGAGRTGIVIAANSKEELLSTIKAGEEYYKLVTSGYKPVNNEPYWAKEAETLCSMVESHRNWSHGRYDYGDWTLIILERAEVFWW